MLPSAELLHSAETGGRASTRAERGALVSAGTDVTDVIDVTDVTDVTDEVAGAGAVAVVGRGGASSGWATTMLAGGVEWSATGRKGASLLDVTSSRGAPGVEAARQRAASRLREMLFSASWPPPRRVAPASGVLGPLQ
jgi:hypothetical protein